MLVAEAVIQALKEEGTERVFSLMDVYNMDLLQALEAQKTTIIRGRHEHGVVLMADGYARVSGRPGICSIGAGPALTQIGTALTTVKRHGSPVLVIFVDTPKGDRHNLKIFDARPFVEAMGAHFVAAASPRSVKADVQRAFRLLRSGAGPVVLSLPLDVLNQNLEAEWKYEATEVPDQRIQPAAEAVEYAAILLKGAKRPVILAGKGAVASGAREQIEALADRTGALLATTL
ncbi:MAG: thiamine pyrophosphate-binding protein, partial [Chloroflexota bacterium]